MNISFELSMPGRNSWNGRWSGESTVYAIVYSFRKMPTTFKLGYYSYDFGDGWRAAVTVREVDKPTAKMLKKRSKGFCGYDWMVDSIISDGAIYGPMKPKPELKGQP
jgi:hypothetical protein